jgi:hypothetical protein
MESVATDMEIIESLSVVEWPLLADCVAKLFLQDGTQIVQAVGAAIEKLCGRPHRLAMNSRATSIAGLRPH